MPSDRQGLGVSRLGGFGHVGLFVSKLFNPGASEMPEGSSRSREACALPNCAQSATQVFDWVRVDDGPLLVCNRHASEIRRWVG